MQIGVQQEQRRCGPTILVVPVSRTYITFRIRNPFVLVLGIGFYFIKVGG